MAKKVSKTEHHEQPEKNTKKSMSAAGRIKLLILFGVMIYAIITIINQQAILSDQQNKRDTLLAQEQQLKNDIEYYTDELEYIGSDKYIIKEAKERLGWLFGDEKKYVELPVDDPEASEQPTVTDTPESDTSAASDSQEDIPVTDLTGDD